MQFAAARDEEPVDDGDGAGVPRDHRRHHDEPKRDERLAEAISDKAVKSWHATNYSNGKKRVYVTFEEVVSA